MTEFRQVQSCTNSLFEDREISLKNHKFYAFKPNLSQLKHKIMQMIFSHTEKAVFQYWQKVC